VKNRLFLIVLSNILLAFVLVGGVVFAQDNPVAVDTGPGAESLLTNSISGRAVDGSGNGVAGVTVTATRVKYPIVFLPGVMGTFLRNEPRSDGDCASSNRPDGTIWLERNASQWQLDLGSLRLNSTGNGPKNNCDRISPDGRLALEVFLDSVKVADYAPYELFLRQAQEDHGFNVLPYDGYDWRLTLTDAVTKLDTFIDANRGSGGKVYLVAHSMGGLALRCWWAAHDGDVRIHHAITIATPHRGTVLARFGLSPNARQMRPGSRWLQALAAAEPADRAARCTCLLAGCDNVVFPAALAVWPGAAVTVVEGAAHLDLIDRPQAWAALERALAG